MKQRVKHTVPPPNVCEGCWWRERYLASVVQIKELRRQAIRKLAARRVLVEKDTDDKPDEPKHEDPDVRDVLEEIARTRDE